MKAGDKQRTDAAEPQNLVICVNVELLNILSSFLLFLYFWCLLLYATALTLNECKYSIFKGN